MYQLLLHQETTLLDVQAQLIADEKIEAGVMCKNKN